MDRNRRKSQRLKHFDYSSNGAYSVNVCTQGRRQLFGSVGEASEISDKIQEIFQEILAQYPHMQCPQYVVMPDHFHALLVIDKQDDLSSKTVGEFMRAFKSKTTVAYI